MEILHMSEKELDRWRIIENVTAKKLTQKQAAAILNISDRQIRNLLKNFNKEGKKGVISKRRNAPSNNKFDEQFKKKVLSILVEKYSGYGPTLSAEKLRENHSIYLSRETIRNWMIEKGIWQIKFKRDKKIHQRRERRSCFGELIQGDGSHHLWIEISGIECCLTYFIDDATSRITSMHLAEEETLQAYFIVLKQHLNRYGRFRSLYVDRSAVTKTRSGDGDTQFERVLKDLGIEIIRAYSPQAKGRIERSNRTLQDRLVKFFKEKKVLTILEANQILEDFRAIYNEKFSVTPKSPVDLHRPLTPGYDVEVELCRIEKRKLTKDLCFSFNNIVYKVKSPLIHRLGNREIEISLLNDGTIKVRKNKQILEVEIDRTTRKSMEEKKILQKNKEWLEEKQVHQISKNHPWKKHVGNTLPSELSLSPQPIAFNKDNSNIGKKAMGPDSSKARGRESCSGS